MKMTTAYKMVTEDNLKEQLDNLKELLENLDLNNISQLKDLRNLTTDITTETNNLISILKNERR